MSKPPTNRHRDELQAEVDATREHLAETVDALTDKLDVPGRAKDKAHEVGDAAKQQAQDPKVQVGTVVVAAAVVGGVILIVRRRRR